MNERLLRVAHIDDDSDLRELVRLALKTSDGFPVLSCASGVSAQEQVPPFLPDIILVDMMMPGMDGLQTISALRKRMDLSGVSVVFLTGSNDDAHVRRFLEAGAAGVIHKPFDVARLGETLRNLHSP